VGDVVAEVRRHAKAVGERLSLLRPSWRGNAPSRSANSVGASGGAAGVGTGAVPATGSTSKVEGLIKTLSTAQSRQQARDTEAVEEAKIRQARPAVPEEKPMLVPPAQALGADGWRISGVYEHQVLKAGLRQLDNRWTTEGLQDLPKAKDGSASGFLRGKLLVDMLTGRISLQSVPRHDVSAAQSDVQRLSLRQLLRLRVLHLDFTPSGCGADSVATVGATNEAFIATLDGLLFQQLGRRAATLPDPHGAPSSGDEHRLGREAVLLVAAGAAVSASTWWCWWISGERRIFFNVAQFTSSNEFPKGVEGVLEVTDLYNGKKCP